MRFALNPAFAETLQKYYFARVIGLDFQRSEAVEAINGWVQDATRGKIPRLLDEIDPRERLFLINALYFQGFWQIPFDPEKTSTENFYRADGSTVSCQMMHRQGEFSVAFLDSLLAVDLPYGNGAFSMTIVLPAEGVSLQSVVAQLNEDRLKAWLAALASREIVLGLPRFRFRNQLHLNDPLSHMGMAIAFDPMRADFSPMQQPGPAAGEKLVVTRVLQNTFVQVDEKGTEAAAVTGIGIGVTSVPPQVTANRPFLFLIREHFAGTILFIGKVEEPVWEK
ncbi:MAG: serpin family protein [Calditrichaeota bacterium]|nr:MAG: serpin family protein [Calditrichota bacterium]